MTGYCYETKMICVFFISSLSNYFYYGICEIRIIYILGIYFSYLGCVQNRKLGATVNMV